MKKKINKPLTLLLVSSIIIILGIIFIYNKKNEILVLKRYSHATKQTEVFEYIVKNNDTILQGKFVKYNEKGDKIVRGNFKNGKIEGKWIYYFDDGSIESIFIWKDEKIPYESTKYYHNGKLKRYTMYDPSGAVTFVINYDKQGNVKDYDGYLIIETYQFEFSHKEKFPNKKEQYLKVGDTLKYKYLIANIPYTKRNLNIELLEADNSKIKRVIEKIPPVETDIKEITTKKGINTIRAIVKYEFNNKEKTVIKDTISFDVEIH